MNCNYDLHLSANKILDKTISKFEKMGFCEDFFANCRRCAGTAYHATYRGDTPLPSDFLWKECVDILREDKAFSGSLEEEVYNEKDIAIISGPSYDKGIKFHKMKISRPSAGKYKACDVHINIDLNRSCPASIERIEGLGIASFDKVKGDYVGRIFTITLDNVVDGKDAFVILSQLLNQIPQLFGKMKFEMISRHFRHPEDANTLPLTTAINFREWKSKTLSYHVQ